MAAANNLPMKISWVKAWRMRDIGDLRLSLAENGVICY